MKTRLLIALAGLLGSLASLSAQSSVWKVTRGTDTLYLGGTLHLLRASDFPLPAEFDEAFAASSTLVFETDIARIQSAEMQKVVTTQGIFTDGSTLEAALTPEAWKAVQDYCAKSGLPVAQINQFKPWFFTIMVTAVELQKAGISMEGVDLHFFKKAGSAGKATGELETFEQQVQFLVNMGAGHESEMITNSLEELTEVPAIIGEVLAAWKVGDVARIDELMLHDARTKYPTIYKDLITDRNDAWIPKIDALLKTPETEFVLVGAGHLAGPEGLLAQLRDRGCTVEQTKAAGR